MENNVPSTRGIAQQLLTLSADPESQVYIAQEAGCLSGLIGYLDSQDEVVIRLSVNALVHLSSHPKNKKTLTNYPGLLQKLVSLSSTQLRGRYDHDTDEEISVLG